MIKVEGYRAFHGTMRITPVVRCEPTTAFTKPIRVRGIDTLKTSNNEPFEIESDWLYKPDTKCWYGQGRSFPADICEVVRDDAVIVRCGECIHAFDGRCQKFACMGNPYAKPLYIVVGGGCSYGKAKEGDDGK